MMYSIKDVSKLTGISEYTLRYYEKEGLMNVRRNEKNIRYYSENDLEWFKLIRCLRETSMSVSDINTIVSLSSLGDNSISERKKILLEHKKKVQNQVKELNKALEKIENKLSWYDGKLEACSVKIKNLDNRN